MARIPELILLHARPGHQVLGYVVRSLTVSISQQKSERLRIPLRLLQSSRQIEFGNDWHVVAQFSRVCRHVQSLAPPRERWGGVQVVKLPRVISEHMLALRLTAGASLRPWRTVLHNFRQIL